MSPEKLFSDGYASARRRFTSACEKNGAQIFSYENVGVIGADGERLFTDVARFGSSAASRLLVIGSGTHGVEGFCGSACQLGFAKSGAWRNLHPDTGILLVHALNPYGFSHCRRVDENNVDLNRNFVNFASPLPRNDAYDELHDSICPEDWFGPEPSDSNSFIEAYIEQNGRRAYQAAISQGQYRHADGLFYGGQEESWSNRNWQSIVEQHMSSAQSVLFIDVHSGLGPFGHGELILAEGSGSRECEQAKHWFGPELTRLEEDESISASVSGPVSCAIRWRAPHSRFLALALEYGTHPLACVVNALRADNWLYSGHQASQWQRDCIKAEIRDAFDIEETRWRRKVWERFSDVTSQALEGLASIASKSPDMQAG